MPALIKKGMVFTAGTSAGSSVLKLIVSERPMNTHYVIFWEHLQQSAVWELKTGMLGSKEGATEQP